MLAADGVDVVGTDRFIEAMRQRGAFAAALAAHRAWDRDTDSVPA